MNLAVCVAINIVTLCGVMYFSCFVNLKPSVRYALVLVWLVLFNMPLYEWSMCDYVYALFDVPRVMLVLISLWWLVGFMWQSLKIQSHRYERLANMRIFPPFVQCVWIIFGIVLYMGFLGFWGVDIYHLEFKILVFILCILGVIVYSVSPLSAYGLIFCMVAYQLEILGDIHIVYYYIDPFLWVGCILAVLIRICKLLIKHYGGKNER